MDLKQLVREMGLKARAAAFELAAADSAAKDRALEAVAAALEAERELIRRQNERDLEAGAKAGLSPAMLDRLRLTDPRITAMIAGVREVIALPDPVGAVYDERVRPNGLRIHRLRVPIGVIGIIYESRPNVTVDASALTLKSGNAVVLRGGSEAIHSNLALAGVMSRAIESAGLPAATVQLVPTTDREAVGAMLRLDDLIDLIIPRGGKESDPSGGGAEHDPGNQALQRDLPRLCRWRGRPEDGRRDRPQRQGAAAGGLQRDGDPAGGPGGRPGVPAARCWRACARPGFSSRAMRPPAPSTRRSGRPPRRTGAPSTWT